jgi:hypothetical protein
MSKDPGTAAAYFDPENKRTSSATWPPLALLGLGQSRTGHHTTTPKPCRQPSRHHQFNLSRAC